MMLFSKKPERCCRYCIHSSPIPQEEEMVLCAKKGIRNAEKNCFQFTYDPCKRTPAKAKALDFAKYEEYDYSL